MAQQFLTILLGTTSAKLAEVAKAGKKVQVFSAYDIPLSEGLCEDGLIINAEALAEELKHYLAMYRIKAKNVVFSIASKRIASKEVLIPFVKEKQIKGIVEINAPEYFPVANIENYAINYSILEIVKKEDSTQYRLTVTATPNDLLEGYNTLAKLMKRKVEYIDYAGNAILQVLKSQIEYGEVCATIQLGFEHTVINVLNGGVLIMQRNVSTGLNAIIASVSESVGLDEESAIAFLEDNNIDKIAGAYPDVKYIVESLIMSIGRIFEFYNGRYSEQPINSVKFIGDATFVNGIGPALSSGLGVQAEEIFTLKNVVVKNKFITPEYATNFMANIGSVIEPMKIMYVSPEDSEAAKDEKLPWSLVVFSLVASLVLGTSSVIAAHNSKKERDALNGQLAALSDMQAIEDQLNEAQSRNQAVQDFLSATKGPNDSLLRLITDLEKIMPIGMSIDSFELSSSNVTLALGGHGKEGIAKFIEEVKALEYVQNVKVDYVSEIIDGMDKYDLFNMNFTLLDINEIEAAKENPEGEATTEENISEEAPIEENVIEGDLTEIYNAGGEE